MGERLENLTWLCEHLGISKATARRMLKAREIPHMRVGHSIRVKPSAVERWLRECRVSWGDGG